jgi:hypothetical protein
MFKLEKEKKRDIRRSIKRMFRGENLTKMIVIIATVALILASVLPYLL